MPVEPLPLAPSPVWSGPGKGLAAEGGATISLAAIPPALPRDVWVAARTRLPWKQGATSTFAVPLPPEVCGGAAGAAQADGPVRATGNP